MSVSNGDSGVVFGPYRVFERIGVGGMATVHRAKEIGIEGFERWVALKRLLPHLAEDASFVRSFVREAKLASLLAHPSIVQIYELGRVGHVYFISMELIEGFDVRQILRQARRVTGPPPISMTVAILAQICEALEYAHSRVDDAGNPVGLVHRDVSPSNVIVGTSGHLKIIDFGIAKAQIQQLQTNTGKVKGKMAYMSPEAIRGLPLDGRSDLFSLGVLAHELLTARPLFATKNDYKTLQRVQNAAVAPPSTYNRDCPPELDAIVLRALERDRDERWQSAGEMLSELIELRQQYQLTTQRRDLAAWLEYAFSVEAPTTHRSGAHPTATAHVPTPEPNTGAPSIVIDLPGEDSLRTPVTGPTGPAQIPIGNVALPIAEEDDEIVEIAWGGRSSHSHNGIVLEEIPDVSSRALSAAGVTTPAPQKRATLVAPAPPPPGKRRPSRRHLAAGTKPPGVDDDLQLDRFPLAVEEDEHGERDITGVVDAPRSIRRPSRSGSVPQVRFRKRTTSATGLPAVELPLAAPEPTRPSISIPTPAPAATTPRPMRTRRSTFRSGGATSIGASIVERRKRHGVRIAVGAALIATLAVAGFFIVPRLGGSDSAAATSKSASTIKLIVEPADAVVSIDGAAPLDGSPAKTRLEPGTYEVSVVREGYKAWRSTLEVVARENQTLRIVLAADTSAASSELVDKIEAPAEPDATVADDADERDRKRRRRAKAPVLEQPEEAMVGGDSGEQPSFHGKLGVPTALDTIEPPKAAPRKPRRGPVLVPPTEVSKKRGSVPKLRDRNGTLPRRMAAELCIDTRGKVKRARLISRAPERIRKRVEKALEAWRYAPYRKDGVALEACFAVSFKTR